jgi:uncharacterized lipoprotein YbaY
MSLKFQILGFLAIGMAILLTGVSAAASKEATPIKQWRGSVEDETLMVGAPKYITSPEALARLWKSWKPRGKAPRVNFKTQFLVVATSRGSGLGLEATLEENGDLKTLTAGTMDIRPGFRYVINLHSRRGVKTVNGKQFSELAGGSETAPGKQAVAKVTGNVLYRERMALPPDAVVEVSLVDVSRADAPAIVLDKQEIKTGRQVPIPFALSYKPSDIKPNFTYAVQARILVGGKLWFVSKNRYQVITQGSPTNIEVLVQRTP